MNETIILGMIQPYLKDSSITYEEFDNLFEMLSLKEQYGVLDILEKNKIELRPDEDDDEDGVEPTDDDLKKMEKEIEDDREFEILYDDSIFVEDNGERDEEVEKQSNYIEKKSKIKQSNEILCMLIQKGNEQAKQDLCIKNRNLVCKVAKRYEKYFGNNLSFEDLEQAGLIGMLKAAEKFHVEYGYNFSTYAMWWIRQSIVREVYDHGLTIRVPVHMMEIIGKINSIERKLIENSMTHHEKIEVIAREIGVSVKYVDYCLLIQSSILNSASLDTPIGENEDTSLLDMIPEKSMLSVEDEVAARVLGETINEILGTLTEKQRKVLELRFGINDGKEHTLEEIGQMIGVTRERIRQIEAKALYKLRQPSRSKKIKDFLE